MMIVIVLSCLAGYLGLLIAPATTPWLWAALLAVGTSAFPVILTLIGLRARTSAGTSALSGFSQSVGYVLAAPGPFLVGVIYEATGTWTVPLLFLSALTVPFLIVGNSRHPAAAGRGRGALAAGQYSFSAYAGP